MCPGDGSAALSLLIAAFVAFYIPMLATVAIFKTHSALP
jgi:hypothetical protein